MCQAFRAAMALRKVEPDRCPAYEAAYAHRTRSFAGSRRLMGMCSVSQNARNCLTACPYPARVDGAQPCCRALLMFAVDLAESRSWSGGRGGVRPVASRKIYIGAVDFACERDRVMWLMKVFADCVGIVVARHGPAEVLFLSRSSMNAKR